MKAKLTMALGLLLLPGCSMLFPGLDTRMAAQATNRVTWDNFDRRDNTTHAGELVVAEGEDVALMMEDGKMTGLTGATHVLWQKHDPESVLAAYTALAQQNAEVAQGMFDTLRALTEALAPLMAASVPLPAPVEPPPP